MGRFQASELEGGGKPCGAAANLLFWIATVFFEHGRGGALSLAIVHLQELD
jgi:hypothetical protein